MHLRPPWGEMMRRGRCTRPTPAMGEREEPSPGLPWERGGGEEFLVTAPPYGKNLYNDTCNTSGEILQWYYLHLQNSYFLMHTIKYRQTGRGESFFKITQ
jgi:hypothetical protein